ncbi:MAG: radical SAM protein [Gaiellales bacterium]|nr:radical SAM protein [Gaiellales bacterium]
MTAEGLEAQETLEPTESLCPVCLRRVPAVRRFSGDDVVLEATCPQHGPWRTVIWRGLPSYRSWCREKASACGNAPPPAASDGCPLECGLCPQHRQSTCTAVVDVTRRCNLHCRICFADAAPGVQEADPELRELRGVLRDLLVNQGPVNVQLSGGEPTLREDLLDIVRAARATGFTFVQVNTNGLRLAAEAGYAERLCEAGLASVFLQFDGLSDATYRFIRGRSLLAVKQRALERCAQAGLGVVLVPTLVPGVNDHELGALVRFAAGWAGVVRGVHFQPVSYFGRYRGVERARLTLPEVLRGLERQTEGAIRASDFEPSSCEHVRCSFRARYWVRDGGELEWVRPSPSPCAAEPGSAARRAIAATARQWGRGPRVAPSPEGLPRGLSGADVCPNEPGDDLDRFLAEAGRILSVSGMLFQDAWSIDLERIRQCCVHAVAPGRGLVPFCLWNLTGVSGDRLYPRRL